MTGTTKKHEGIIVLGPPRSGTTLLRRLLDAHPNISCPPETNVFTAAGRFLQEDPIGEGVKFGPTSSLAYSGIDPNETIRRLRELCFGFFRTIAEKQNKPRWASKTPQDAFYVDAIERLCGEDAHFICLVRHGLDVACSIQELSLENEAFFPEVHEYVKRYLFPLEAFAHLWQDVTQRLAKFAKDHPDNAIVVRYEDLVADPNATLERIFTAVGEEHDPSLAERALKKKENVGLGDFKAYKKTSIEKSAVGRNEKLSPHTRSRLGAIINPTLVAQGYEAIPVLEDRTDAEVRRRYEMGLFIQSMKKPAS